MVRDTECPVSQRYEPRLAELQREYGARGYAFVLLDVTPHGLAEARAAAAKFPEWRSLRDERRVVAAGLRVKATAEAFVIDPRGTLRYRGAIDDQYGIDFQRAAPDATWLRDALDAVARGEEPKVRTTEPRGCPMASSARSPVAARPVTYHERVSRIVQQNCQACHRTGGLAPMPFETYAQVHARRAVIEAMVRAGRMPPWSAHPAHGRWANDRSLRDADRKDLLAWIAAGGPEGDPALAPLPRAYVPGWNIGKPDLVLPIPEPIRVPAQGVIAYQVVYAQAPTDRDQWITAMEIRPTQPKVVHHVLAFLEEPGRKAPTPEQVARWKPGDTPLAWPSDSVSNFFAVTVPGSLGMKFPPGTGKKLPKGAWIKFEIHYQPNGTEVVDRTEIGFRFSAQPLREVESRSAFNTTFVIPPGHARYPVKAAYTFPDAGRIVSLFPHMHMRGAGFRYDLRYPGGRTVRLLEVPKFDFSWQSYYEAAEPIAVPKGAQLLVTAWFDNSRGNTWNPDATKSVRWGLQTWEEMMIGYFDFVADGPRATPVKPAGR